MAERLGLSSRISKHRNIELLVKTLMTTIISIGLIASQKIENPSLSFQVTKYAGSCLPMLQIREFTRCGSNVYTLF